MNAANFIKKWPNFPLIFLNLLCCFVSSSVDPLTGFIRDFSVNTKETVQQFINQLPLPRIGPRAYGPSLFGSPSSSSMFGCPHCGQFPPELLSGQWHLALMSRSFRLNTLNQLDGLIDRTMAGRPFQEGQPGELFGNPPEPICPTMIVLDAAQESTKWELAYALPNGQPTKSIIGQLDRLPFGAGQFGTLLWRVGSLNLAQFCIALASSSSSSSSSIPLSLNISTNSLPMTNSSNSSISSTSTSSPSSSSSSSPIPQQSAFVLLNQMDGWPRCGNFLLLARNMPSEAIGQIRDQLEEQMNDEEGDETINTRLERPKCRQWN